MIDKTPSADAMRGWVKSHRDKNTPIQQFDIGIDANGQWFHEGSPIQREKLVKLFASILTRLENGAYALVTPAEIGTITVEDAPFIVTKMDIENRNDDTGDGMNTNPETDRMIRLTTSVGDTITLDADHQIILREYDGMEKPYIQIRDGLDAVINRAVFYEMAEHSVVYHGQIGIWSSGLFHPLSSQAVDEDQMPDTLHADKPAS
ncbi:MAG: DUF1285 domain-containing protein [Candidatus Puniceispirillales bacterium]